MRPCRRFRSERVTNPWNSRHTSVKDVPAPYVDGNRQHDFLTKPKQESGCNAVFSQLDVPTSNIERPGYKDVTTGEDLTPPKSRLILKGCKLAPFYSQQILLLLLQL